MKRTKALVASGCLFPLLLAGCRMEKHRNGGDGDVKIATPFGGLQVNSNDAVVMQGIGLPAYPGATLVKEDKNHGAADVNLSFGSFKLRIKAVNYRTVDAPETVTSFYRDALKQYGGAILCTRNKPVGEPAATPDGLTCENEHDNIQVNDELSGQMELKAGSKQHQHIVSIESEGAGTKFGLIALDLPGKIKTDNQDHRQ